MPSIDDEALDWAARQSVKGLDAQEQAAFDAWYAAAPRHQGAYLRALAIQHSLDQVSAQENLKPRPGVQADAREGKRGHGRRNFMFGGAMAAGLAALAAFSLRPPGRAPHAEPLLLATGQGELRKVPLADRSVVSMNSASELEVDMSGSERRVSVKRGEAWFDVAKDKSRPFIVASGGLRVRAVGTAFSVRRHAGGAEVLVTEGVVEVWRDGGPAQKRRLAAGDQSFVDDAATAITVQRDPDGIEGKLAWREGKLAFRNRALGDAAADFNRYNVRQILIADPALARKTVVGQYRMDRPDNFAEDVRTLFHVPVNLGAERITIGALPATRRAGQR